MTGGFNKKTIKDVDMHGKTVLLRADYNVPIDKNGKITDDYRITQSVETVRYIIEQGAKLIICSHLGRPDGYPDIKYSLAPVVKRLEKLINKNIDFVSDCVGEEVSDAINKLRTSQILMLENLRFHKEEENNDDDFAKELASFADIFVEDGFGVVHRAHASTEGVTHHLPSVAGLLLEKEVRAITQSMDSPQRPLIAIIGGAKISDKIDILRRFVDIADFVVVGGAMANTFLHAEDIPTGHSVIDNDDLDMAKEIINLAKEKAKKDRFVFYLPQDGVVAKEISPKAKTRIVDWGAHVISSIENYPKLPPKEASRVKADEMILDIGPFSGAFIAGGIQLAGSVIWNGSMGVTETKGLLSSEGPFSNGTEIIVDALLGKYGHKPKSVVGGGDTVSYIEQRKLTDFFDHVSTGGGASLELMSGKKLPGIEALLDKSDTIVLKDKRKQDG